jgi:HlyD family secretion protein
VDIRLINAGLPARVELDALPDVSIPAEIEQIALVGTNENGIVSYDVDLTLDANDPRVRVGMTAEANVIVTERENVLVIPNIYVRLDRERAFVNLLRPDGTIEEVEVTLGLQGQETSEVVDGLEEGDVIVIDPDGEGVSFF